MTLLRFRFLLSTIYCEVHFTRTSSNLCIFINRAVFTWSSKSNWLCVTMLHYCLKKLAPPFDPIQSTTKNQEWLGHTRFPARQLYAICLTLSLIASFPFVISSSDCLWFYDTIEKIINNHLKVIDRCLSDHGTSRCIYFFQSWGATVGKCKHGTICQTRHPRQHNLLQWTHTC